MKNKLLSTIAILLLHMVYSCVVPEEDDYGIPDTLRFENATDETVYVYFGTFTTDTFCLAPHDIFTEISRNGLYEVAAGSTLDTGIKYIKPEDYFQMVIFSKATLDAYSDNELYDNDIFDKKYIYSGDLLDSMRRTIKYRAIK